MWLSLLFVVFTPFILCYYYYCIYLDFISISTMNIIIQNVFESMINQSIM